MLVLYLFIWSWLGYLSTCIVQAGATQLINVTIPITSPDITFTPFLCNTWGDCQGAWTLRNVSNELILSTSGPDPSTGNIIPQLFVNFRAYNVYVKLYVKPAAPSNATANMTASTPSGQVVSVLLNSTFAEADIVDLIDSDVTTLAITYIPGTPYLSLNIESIVITVTDNDDPSSYLPSQSLPTTIPPLTFSPTPTSTSTSEPTSSSSRHRPVNLELVQAFSLVLGIGLGLSCITAIVLTCLKRKQQRKVRKSSVGVGW